MRRSYSMPFGSELMVEGGVCFRLWAPAAKKVDLCIENPEGAAILAMSVQGGGWFELKTEQAAAGSLYRYQIDGEIQVPDPASRLQPEDVHGPSEVINPRAFEWQDKKWTGRPWEEAVIYETHVGAFTAEDTFQALEARLDPLLELGVTALELMPIADS